MDKVLQRKRNFTEDEVEEIRDLLEVQQVSVRIVSEKKEVHISSIYYWVKKAGMQLPRKEKKGKWRPPKPKYTWYYYVNKMYKKGDITDKEKRKMLNKFYQNRKNYIYL